MNQFTVGTLVNLDVLFKDVNGDPVDPTDVTCFIRLPDGEEQNLSESVIPIGPGQYRVEFQVTMNGLHEYRFAGTGAVAAAGENFFMGQTVFPEGVV